MFQIQDFDIPEVPDTGRCGKMPCLRECRWERDYLRALVIAMGALSSIQYSGLRAQDTNAGVGESCLGANTTD